MIDRDPSAFERATADALWSAYRSMPKAGDVHAFTALSAATGAGKTTSACALMTYLARTEAASCAYVVSTIAVAEEVHRHLAKLLPGEVACYTSVHKVGASPRTLDNYADQNVTPSAQYTEAAFRSARLVVTTHERWRHEVASKLDLGVLKHNGKDRSLIVVDEEPELDHSVVRQPEDVSALASLLADVTRADEARGFGFSTDHHAAETLLSIHGRMRSIKDNAVGHYLQAAEVVTADDLKVLESVTTQDLTARVMALGISDRTEALDYHRGTLEFLKLAAQGRVFYSRDEGGAFYAYGFPVQPQPRHLILDGTADLNGMYAVGKHVSVVSAVPANYERVKLYAVQPPKRFRGRMRNTGILCDDREVEDYLSWFMPFLLERTKPGQHVLVYCKKLMLSYGVHKAPEFDDSGSRHARYTSTLQGRTIHWCSFGRGRGSNDWKHCTAYFRLGDFMLKKALMMARIAATTGERYTAADLRRYNSGALKDVRLKQAESALLATTNKQDAARICIRHLDDDGRAAAAELYMVDCDLATLQSYRERMFPEATQYTVITCEDNGGTTEGTARVPNDGAASRVASLLLTTDLARLTVADLVDRCGMKPNHYARTLATTEVREAMTARDWTETTRRAVGLPGKGKMLARATA